MVSLILGVVPLILRDDPLILGDFPLILGDDPLVLGDFPLILGDDPPILGGDPLILGDKIVGKIFKSSILKFKYILRIKELL